MTWFQRMYRGSWLTTSRRQSYTAPSSMTLLFSSAMRASVKTRGCSPVFIAAFSAGSPNESNPNGDKHRLAVHRPVPDEQVTERVVADVALVSRPARVRVHAQHVRSGARVVQVHLVGVLVGPALLPALLDLLSVVCPDHPRSVTGADQPTPGRAAARRRSPDGATSAP